MIILYASLNNESNHKDRFAQGFIYLYSKFDDFCLKCSDENVTLIHVNDIDW